MKLTTKGRYAVTAMLDLAIHAGSGPITLADVANRQHISLSYLEQLFARLRKKSLVSSVRGPGGGYILGRDAKEISVAEVIVAVDEHVDTTRCAGPNDCLRNRPCLTHSLWEDLSARIYEHLDGISLHDLVMNATVRRVAKRQDSIVDGAQQDPNMNQFPGVRTVI